MSFSSYLGDIGNDIKQNFDNLKSDFQNALNSKLNSKVSGLASPLPWQSNNSRFYPYIIIKPDRWDQLFPYRLLVIDTKKNNQIVNGTPQSELKVTKDNGKTTLHFVPLGNQWVFSLPITPQQLNITDQFAINTSATLRGVIEEHSGVKFKMISASGTMGVWPFRESIVTPPGSPSLVQSVFGGTIEAIGSALNQVARTINSATSGHPATKPISKRPETSSAGVTSTGYYHALAFQQFLEQYAEAKKNPVNAGWRLVFDIPKQNQSFIVTPMPFTWQQNVNKPMAVSYQVQFKAWRRIDLKQKVSPIATSVQSITPGIMQRILNTISEARKATSAAINLIGAVRSDVNKPLDALRQSSLFVKDLAGVAVTAADLPFQLQRDFSSAIKDSLVNLKGAIDTLSSDGDVRGALQAISDSSKTNEGLSNNAVAGGQLGTNSAKAQSIDPANNVFTNAESNFSLMDEVPLSSMRLNPAQQRKVDNALTESRSLTVDDLKTFRATIQELATQLSNNFGSGDAYYNSIYGKAAPKTRLQAMTLDEYDILKTLYDVMSSYDILTATTELDDLNKQTNMEYVANLADLSGINFELPNSKVLVPVPFGLTIEAIAARYLGDPQRWLEIVTLNNLRDPYIDEDGFKNYLLSNASGRQLTIDNIDNMYIGQRVLIKSLTQAQTARKILDIDKLSDTSYLITLDGEADLDNYLLADSAYLQAYLPGTVNSQQKIFIPSDIEVPTDPNIVTPSSVQGDPYLGLSKVDWLLTDTGDVAVNSFGDFRFSVGITNLIQALKIKIGTPKGSKLTHPEFGLGIRAGIINSEVDIQDIYNSITKLIEEDPRFQGLSGLQLSINGPVMSISMGVVLAGQNGVYPLTFELPV